MHAISSGLSKCFTYACQSFQRVDSYQITRVRRIVNTALWTGVMIANGVLGGAFWGLSIPTYRNQGVSAMAPLVIAPAISAGFFGIYMGISYVSCYAPMSRRDIAIMPTVMISSLVAGPVLTYYVLGLNQLPGISAGPVGLFWIDLCSQGTGLILAGLSLALLCSIQGCHQIWQKKRQALAVQVPPPPAIQMAVILVQPRPLEQLQ